MEQITEVVKKHPVAIGVGVLILVLLIAKSGSGGGSASAYLQSQSTAAQTDLALSKINADVSSKRDQLAASLWAHSIDANAANNSSQQESMTQLVLGALGYKATLAQLADQHDIQSQQIAASQSIASQNLSASVATHLSDVNAKLSEFGRYVDLQHYGIDTNAQQHAADVGQYVNLQRYAIDSTSQNLPALVAYQTARDSTAGETAKALAAINGQTAQAVAALNTSAARTTAQSQSNLGMVGSLVDIASSFFGL